MFWFWSLLSLICLGCSEDGEVLLKRLTNLQTALTGPNSTLTCWGDDYTGSRDDFITQKYRPLVQQYSSASELLPVLLYPMCLRTFQLGNTIGYYLNDMACAMEAGLHFVGSNQQFKIQQPEFLEVAPEHAYSFLEALPSVRMHPSPRKVDDAMVDIKAQCNCLQYCWENKAAPWSRHLYLVSEVLEKAIDGYLAHYDTARGTTINNTTDLCSRCSLASSDEGSKGGNRSLKSLTDSEKSSPTHSAVNLHARLNQRFYFAHHAKHAISGLPLVPEVAVQYRCGDNIGFGKTRYGLLPFKAISSRIPDSAREIYVLADGATRSPHSVYSGRCGQILEALYKHLVARFPFALVVVKRGGDIFLDVARMVRAKILICSASTFCLWPALANQNIVHYPLTPLVLGAWNGASAPSLSKSFRWIEDKEQLREFKHYRPWSKVIDALENG